MATDAAVLSAYSQDHSAKVSAALKSSSYTHQRRTPLADMTNKSSSDHRDPEQVSQKVSLTKKEAAAHGSLETAPVADALSSAGKDIGSFSTTVIPPSTPPTGNASDANTSSPSSGAPTQERALTQDDQKTVRTDTSGDKRIHRTLETHTSSQGLDSQLLETAIQTVLQERYGVMSLQQLPSTDVQTLLNSDLPQVVAQHIQKDPASIHALNNVDPANAQAATRKDGNLSLDFSHGAQQSPDAALKGALAPFPADALPSEIQLEQNTNLYLNGLGEHITDDELLRIGSQYGEIISHKAIINSESGLCKGYGFIMYARARDAAIAIVELQKLGYQTSFARHESFSAKLRMMSDARSTNVYVSNLPLDMDETNLERLVAPHQIVSRRILSKPDGNSRGVGFIRFQSRDVAQECIDLLHGKRLPGHPHPLQARFADSENQKRLKQDTTLRKIYADLDMGVLRSPSGGNLRPGPLSNGSSTRSTATPMRSTSSEPCHLRLDPAIMLQQQQQYGLHPNLSPRVVGGGSIPMSATTSNASFYPGPAAAAAAANLAAAAAVSGSVNGTPPAQLSHWFGLEQPALWNGNHGLPLSPYRGVSPQQHNLLANNGAPGWLIPTQHPQQSSMQRNLSNDGATRSPSAMRGLWSPNVSGGTPHLSPSADSGAGGTTSAFDSPSLGDQVQDGQHTGVSSNMRLPDWLPAGWSSTLRNNTSSTRGDDSKPSAVEQKHLGSLLAGEDNAIVDVNGDYVPWSAGPNGSHLASFPADFNFVMASGRSAVPIIDPQTGRRLDGEQLAAAAAGAITPSTARQVVSNALHTPPGATGKLRSFVETRSESYPVQLSEAASASTPTMAASVSHPCGLTRNAATSASEATA